MRRPKVRFDLGFPSLQFSKSAFATDIHVKRLDSLGHLQCGYSHLTKEGVVHSGWSRISISCSFESVPAWSCNWTREPPSTSSNRNLSSKTISDLQKYCCKITEEKKRLEIASSRLSYPAQLVLGCFLEDDTNFHLKMFRFKSNIYCHFQTLSYNNGNNPTYFLSVDIPSFRFCLCVC